MDSEIISHNNTNNFEPNPWKNPQRGKPIQEDSFIELFKKLLQQWFSALMKVHFPPNTCHYILKKSAPKQPKLFCPSTVRNSICPYALQNKNYTEISNLQKYLVICALKKKLHGSFSVEKFSPMQPYTYSLNVESLLEFVPSSSAENVLFPPIVLLLFPTQSSSSNVCHKMPSKLLL